jgi:hypothetical protein
MKNVYVTLSDETLLATIERLSKRCSDASLTYSQRRTRVRYWKEAMAEGQRRGIVESDKGFFNRIIEESKKK